MLREVSNFKYIIQSSLFYSIILPLFLNSAIFSQIVYISEEPEILIQPQPKRIKFTHKVVTFPNNGINILASTVEEIKAVNYLQKLLNEKHPSFHVNVSKSIKQISENEFCLVFNKIEDNKEIEDQHYSITFNEHENKVVIKSSGIMGLLYGAVTVSNLFFISEKGLQLYLYDIDDYPLYKRRIFPIKLTSSDVQQFLDFALKNKIETIAIKSRRYAWNEISKEYSDMLDQIKIWKEKYGGPKIMQMHNIYEGKDIVISDKDNVDALKYVIKTTYSHGVEKLMILADDTPPFKFGEGYILTDKRDKDNFEYFEVANTYLMNELEAWVKKENMKTELYYVPAFYTYEEMHQGDMSLYKNTPWEEDAFQPFYRYLSYVSKNISNEIFIVWCGPYVRSRKITEEDLSDWTKNLSGRVPFLWDNTIYSHYPFTSTSMLTAWDNELPEKFYEITAGNGMLINSDANSEMGVVGIITSNDYLWDPEMYNPEKSLKDAINREYGSNVVNLILQFKEAELKFRKVIGERKLWFEADTLWQQIREVRFITNKNPFYYHLNYTRLKALWLQLKSTIPEPRTKKDFIQRCNELFNNKSKILEEIKELNYKSYLKLMKMSEPLPELSLIQ